MLLITSTRLYAFLVFITDSATGFSEGPYKRTLVKKGQKGCCGLTPPGN